MRFALITDPRGFDCVYGRIPNVGNESSDSAEVFLLEDGDIELLDEDFVDPVCELCDVLLDIGDADYFDTVKCEMLAEWLENRLESPCNPRLGYLYDKLHGFAKRACELGTGVLITL